MSCVYTDFGHRLSKQTRRLWKINAMFVLWAGGRLPFQLPDGNIGFTQPLHTLLGMERDRLHIDPDVVQLFSRIFGLDGRLGSLFGGN